MLKIFAIVLLPLLMLFNNSSENLLTASGPAGKEGNTGILEKMIVADGSVAIELNLDKNAAKRSVAKTSTLRFNARQNSFFTILVFNSELRGVLPSSMELDPQGSANVPSKLSASFGQLVLENTEWGERYELVIRDGKSGFTFFNIEAQQTTYDPNQSALSIEASRLLLSKEFAAELGRPSDAGSVVGKISVSVNMRPIEITQIVDGDVKSDVLPATPFTGSVPGPDVVVGDLNGLAQFGSSGTQVGLAVGTDSCNFGTVDLNWFALPDNDHPVIPQNMYRMSGGASNNERFEQVGQSNVKHAFTALTNNICGLGCNGVGGTHLGSGCSDPYSASLNAGPNLGSRAWINPFTGFYPRGDSATPPNNHSGHTHTGISHRIIIEQSDLSTSANPGATYFAEAMYVTPHEYAWCQTHPGQCNMYNNVSYRQYNVSGTTSFSFSPAASTVRQKSAINAWTGASLVPIQPDPGIDGIGTLGYKVTNPSPGVWHYEYAIYNQNLDRGIRSFSLPLGTGITVSNVGFHAPPQQPGWSADGTMNDAGFSSTSWTPTQTANSLTWATETFAQNPNANAIRWGTLYNFRFDSNTPPQTVNATIGFYKTGAPITVSVQGPAPMAVATYSISGRVFSPDGMPLRSVYVTLGDQGGGSRITLTSSFGYYFFDNVTAGDYTLTVSSKRYNFNPRFLTVNDNLTDVDFMALP
jgi:hypothetical protein